MLRVGASSCKMQIRYARLVRFCDDDTVRFFFTLFVFFLESVTRVCIHIHVYTRFS